MKTVCSIGILLWIVATPSVSAVLPHAAGICSGFGRLAPEAIAQPLPKFLEAHRSKYTYEVESPQVRNQCATSGCWAFQTVAGLEREIKEHTGRDIRLSEAWIMLLDVREKARRAAGTPNETIRPGGTAPQSLDVVRRYGLMPAGWKPRVDIFHSDHMSRLYGFVNRRLARFHRDVAREPDKREEWVRTLARDVDHIILTFSGELPTAIAMDGKKLSPVEFASRILPKRYLALVYPPKVSLPRELEPKTEPQPAQSEPPPPKTTEPAADPVPAPDWSARMPWERIDALIVDQIRKGRSVGMSYETASEYTDRHTGIMSISAFPAPEGLERPLNRAERRLFGMSGTHHAVEIVGVDVDAHGRIVKLKIRNSWGDRSGDGGYYHMYADYFREYMTHLTLRQKTDPAPKLKTSANE